MGKTGSRIARSGSRPVAKDRHDERARFRLPKAHCRDLATKARRRPELLAKGIALLERLDHIHGPKPGTAAEPGAIVVDNPPVHASKAPRAALAWRKLWLTPERIANSAPERNDVARDWKTVKANHLAHNTSANGGNLKIFIVGQSAHLCLAVA
jgi:hypothetical protein